MALLAEQDNRVQIANGTAAVNAERTLMTKVGHWVSREGQESAPNIPSNSISQKTYEADSPPACE